MSTDEIVDKVLLIVGVGPNTEPLRRKVEREIRLGLGYIRSQRVIASGRRPQPDVTTDEHAAFVTTGKHKSAARKAELAIRRLQDALRNPDLVRHDPMEYTLDNEGYSLDTTLEELRQRHDEDAQKPLSEKRYRARDWSAHEAAKTTARILQLCDLPLSLGKTGPFVKIAAVLFGKPGADLRKICADVRRELRST